MITNEAMMPQIFEAFATLRRVATDGTDYTDKFSKTTICVHLCNLWQKFSPEGSEGANLLQNHYF
jgi:hypothetical protein